MIPLAAQALAEAGFPVFPCKPNKHPWTLNGFYDASTDAATLETLWYGKHNSALVAVPTGEASGIDVLDVDPRNGGLKWWDANHHRLPLTRIHRTGSGGYHVLFQHYDGVRNTEGQMAPGVDTRGTGGYAIWWPAEGIDLYRDAPVAPWAGWMLSAYFAAIAPKAPSRRILQQRSASSSMTVEAARRMVDRQVERVRHAGEGQRHYRLRAASCTVGGVLSVADISESDAFAQLVNAVIDAGAENVRNAERTALWGLRKGSMSPLAIRDNRHE